MEWTGKHDKFVLGVNYLSDLGVTDEHFLAAQEIRSAQQVGAVNAYLRASFEKHEITAEMIKALEQFDQLDRETDQPMAWNLEFAWMPYPQWQLAFRVENSAELEDAPQRQLGLSSSWLIGKIAHFSIDYLYGEYPPGLVEDDFENELKSLNSAAIQLSIEF